MPIIRVKDNKNNRWKRNTKTKTKEQGDESYTERVKYRWFCLAFKLGFFQLICKAFLIFKSNLEFLSILSIIL